MYKTLLIQETKCDSLTQFYQSSQHQRKIHAKFYHPNVTEEESQVVQERPFLGIET